MKAGASGGGWLNAGGQLVSLTSFGYRKQPDFIFGPYLTSKASRLVALGSSESSAGYPFRDGDRDANGDRGLRERQARRRRAGDAPTATKDAALARLAELLDERADEVLEANAADLADERAAGLTEALRDRLALDPSGSRRWPEGVRAIVALADPVGEELERRTLDNGLDLRKLRVPLGVVAVIYEARPNVTVDCAALCLKSGNAIVLRRLELRRALQRGPRRRSCARPWSTRGCPRARSSCWPATAPSSSSWRPPRAWSSS